MTTIGERIASIRNQVKSVKQDAFLTDRFVYSLIMKHASLFMRRQDSLNRIMKFNSVFQPLKYMELIEVDKAEAQCHCVVSGCYFKRTKYKLPTMMEGYYGPIIRSVTSLDGSENIDPTFPTTYERASKQKNFKYNKTKYFWFLDGYLYFPNLDWDAVRIEGVFQGDVSKFNCDPADNCGYIQNNTFYIPDFLFSEIEQFVMRDLGITLQIPQDIQHDNRHIIR